MKLILPMAGEGSRFQSYSMLPKYMIEILEKPMIVHGLKGLGFLPENIVAIVRKDHEKQFQVEKFLKKNIGEALQIVFVDRTKGASETVLLGLEGANINPSDVICIKDADCISIPREGWKKMIEKDSTGKNQVWLGTYSDGGSYEGGNTNKSHVRLDQKERIIEVREKIRISPLFIAGHYIFSKASLFATLAEEVFQSWRVNPKTTELYLSCVAAHFLASEGVVNNLPIQEYTDLGTPDALKTYVQQS